MNIFAVFPQCDTNIKKILFTVRSISEPLPKVSCKFAFGSGSLYPLCANRLYVELEG